MDVSKNSGTPKSSILIRFSLINHRFWGNYPYFRKHSEYFFVELKLHFPRWQNCINWTVKGLQKTCTSSTLNSWRLRTSSSMWGSQCIFLHFEKWTVLCSCLALKQNKLVLICQEIFRKHCTFVQTFPSYTYFYITLNVCRRLSSRKKLKKEMKSSTSLLLKDWDGARGLPLKGDSLCHTARLKHCLFSHLCPCREKACILLPYFLPNDLCCNSVCPQAGLHFRQLFLNTTSA